MKASDLRINNWVFNETTGENMQVYPMMIPQLSRIDDKEHNIKPIPLTEEILLKCGFILLDKNYDIQEFNFYKLGDFTYNTSHNVFWFHNNYSFTQPKYIHQLQNLYYALTGQELEIEL